MAEGLPPKGISSELLRASQQGDGGALEVLLVRHLPDLRAFVRVRCSPLLRARESQSDLVQSVCREILAHPERFDFQGEPQFRNWLFGAVLQRLGNKEDYWKAGKRDGDHEVYADSHATLALSYGCFTRPGADLITAEEIDRIERALDQLKEEQREVLSLHRFVGLTHAEIAEQLGKTEAAVRMVLHRGLARLSSLLEDGE